jgi:hypothetical protein
LRSTHPTSIWRRHPGGRKAEQAEKQAERAASSCRRQGQVVAIE